jgi:hypothetical protein
LIYLDPSGDECNCEECQEAERFRVEQFDRILREELKEGRAVVVAKGVPCPSTN